MAWFQEDQLCAASSSECGICSTDLQSPNQMQFLSPLSEKLDYPLCLHKSKWGIWSAQGEPASSWPPASVLVWQSSDLKCKERSNREFVKCKSCGFGVKIAQGGWARVEQCGGVGGFSAGPWWNAEKFPTAIWKFTSVQHLAKSHQAALEQQQPLYVTVPEEKSISFLSNIQIKYIFWHSAPQKKFSFLWYFYSLLCFLLVTSWA